MFKYILVVAICSLMAGHTMAQTTKTAVQYYNEGVKFQGEEKYVLALDAFKKAIAKNPNYKEAFYYAGWTSNELKKYTEAITYLQKAKALWPSEAKVYLELGYAQENLKKKTEAIESYNKAISLKSDYALAYKYLGSLYYDEYDYNKAVENLNFYLQYEPDSEDEDVYFRKAVSENELELYNQALASINTANSLKPNNVKINNELGYTHFLLGNTDDALAAYDKAFSLDNKSVTAINGRADVYRKLKNDPTEAIKIYAKALEISPKNTKANYWTGWCYNELGKYNDAVPFLKTVIAADPQYVSAYTELGYCDYALKNYDDALINFKKAFSIEKTALNLYYTGLCYIGKKQKGEAEKMVNELKDMKSDYAAELQKEIDKM